MFIAILLVVQTFNFQYFVGIFTSGLLRMHSADGLPADSTSHPGDNVKYSGEVVHFQKGSLQTAGSYYSGNMWNTNMTLLP